jgi:ABC-type phosphate transport system substrate-binding protein
MRPLHATLALSVLALSGMALAAGEEIKIIANPSITVSAISADEIKRVFLGTKTTLEDGGHAEPVIKKGGATHEEFVKKYLCKTSVALETYYRSLVFTGKGAIPKSFASDAEVAAYVAKTKGAIGYVSVGTNTPGAKTVDVR